MRNRLDLTLLLALVALPAQAKDGKRIFISVDMEGIGGAVTDQQLGVSNDGCFHPRRRLGRHREGGEQSCQPHSTPPRDMRECGSRDA